MTSKTSRPLPPKTPPKTQKALDAQHAAIVRVSNMARSWYRAKPPTRSLIAQLLAHELSSAPLESAPDLLDAFMETYDEKREKEKGS